MIDTEETGQKKWDEVVKALHTGPWSEWDFRFISGLKSNPYRNLSRKQQDVIGNLHEKLVRG